MTDRPESSAPGPAGSILALLRDQVPRDSPAPEMAEALLDRCECGGYLHARWGLDGRLGSLPPAWAGPLARAHRRTVLDNLAALAAFRRLGAHLTAERVPFILLKGAAYLVDLYRDPGARRLTDIDLLVRRSDAGRMARRLRQDGYQGAVGAHYPEDRRFEMWRPGPGECRMEVHWSLGLPLRARVDQEGIWERSRPCVLEGVFCRRLGPEDALLYHAWHAADSYFGPSLKWAIDLREMLRAWRPDIRCLLERGAAWRCRTALHLAARHMEKIFPGQAPTDLIARTAPGRLRARLLAAYLADDPLALLTVSGRSDRRYPLRCLMLDSPVDAGLLSLRVLSRPVLRPLARLAGRDAPPWEWSD